MEILSKKNKPILRIDSYGRAIFFFLGKTIGGDKILHVEEFKPMLRKEKFLLVTYEGLLPIAYAQSQFATNNEFSKFCQYAESYAVKNQKKEDASIFNNLLNSKKEIPRVTLFIVSILILFFVIKISNSNTNNLSLLLIESGGLQSSLFFHGELFRLFTSISVHGNFSHLFFNLILLLYSGYFLERKAFN
ncbi:MAG: rhomboid family intramembrane serine protease [Porticoccaceae bacterium]